MCVREQILCAEIKRDVFTVACSARCMWYQADALAKMRSLLFWCVTELRFVVSDVSGRYVDPGIILGPIDSPETSVTTLRKVTSKKSEHPDARRFSRSGVCYRLEPISSGVYSASYQDCRIVRGTALQAGRSRVRFPMVSFRPHYGPVVDSASNNEYQEYFLRSKGGRCVGLTTLPPSCADCRGIWEPQPPETLMACKRCVMG